MTSIKLRIPLLAAMLGAAFMMVSSDYVQAGAARASAIGQDKSNSRKASKGKKGAEKPDFPNTQREERDFKMSSKYSKLVTKGLDALNEDDFDKSEAAFLELLQKPKISDSEKAMAYQVLGNIAYERDDDAVKTIEYNIKALETDALKNNDHFRLMLLNAQLYLQEEKYDETVKWADRWLRETGEERDTVLMVKGQAYYQEEKYPEAAATIKRAIEVSAKPNDNWYAVLMACYTESENYAEAIEYGESVLARDPNNKSIIKQLSNVFIESDQEPRALALMDRAYTSGLLTTEAELRQMAQLYAYGDKIPQGAEVLVKGIASGVLKEDLSTYALMGEVYSQGEDHLKTAEAFGKAAQYAPDGDMKFRQAYALYDAEKLPEARVAAKEALAKAPFKHEGQCWVVLGNIEIELNNKAGAIAAFEKAVKFPATKTSAESWLKNARRM